MGLRGSTLPQGAPRPPGGGSRSVSLYICLCICVTQVCMCVCVDVCMCVCLYVVITACPGRGVFKPSQGCMCVCMYACMYVCVYMHIYACACMQCLICTAKRSKHAASTKADGPPSALPFRYLQWESPQDHCQRWGWSRPITHIVYITNTTFIRFITCITSRYVTLPCVLLPTLPSHLKYLWNLF